MAENKYNLYELQKKIPYKTVAPILIEWAEQSNGDVTDLARMAYDAGRNSISKEKNKMEQIAQLFGKKLGKEFAVKYQISKYKWCIEYHLAFTDKGLIHHGKSKDVILRQLLTGQAVIVDGEE